VTYKSLASSQGLLSTGLDVSRGGLFRSTGRGLLHSFNLPCLLLLLFGSTRALSRWLILPFELRQCDDLPKRLLLRLWRFQLHYLSSWNVQLIGSIFVHELRCWHLHLCNWLYIVSAMPWRPLLSSWHLLMGSSQLRQRQLLP
jgi:hypothetical protein